MKKILAFILILASFGAWSQVKLKRNGNSTLALYNASHPQWNANSKLNKWGKKDTLKLPFFDEFISTKVYPDSTKWFNNQVYINNDFPVKPPSYGVATFDDLDSKGNPRHELNNQAFGACDTLLSLPINLKDTSGKLYTPADSIYFSFYFQRQGLGDASDSRDLLILQFKDNSGNFNTVFTAGGGNVSPFEIVMIGIKDPKFLFKGFQFRFINFALHTGNMNQWHVDYVHLAMNRKLALNFYDDIAIQSQPTSLLNNFYQLPYDHFQADSAKQKAKEIFIDASNLHNVNKNVEAHHIEWCNGIKLVETFDTFNSNNILAMGSAQRRFQGFNLNNLTGPPGKPIVVKRDYGIREAGIILKNTVNDKMTVYQEFGSCYAFDDGTAEFGFGFDDDEFHPDLKGAIAYKFPLIKPDSLWAIGMFFNRSVKSSAAFQFDLKVWQKISPVGTGRKADVSLRTMKGLTPKFTDSINGYHIFYLDTPLFLPKGDFFIGWEQEGNFHLDVGWDMNNGYNSSDIHNNLFFLDNLGNWQEFPPSGLPGALMMRPYVGKKVPIGPVKVSQVKKQDIKCYPNPFTNKITVDYTKGLSKLKAYDLSGKLINESLSNEMDMSLAQPGIYTLQVTLQNGEVFHQKMVKLQ